MPLSDEDINRIADAVSEKHRNLVIFDDESFAEHEAQHEWLSSAIKASKAKEEEAKAKKEFYKFLLSLIIQWSIPMVLGYVFYHINGDKPQ